MAAVIRRAGISVCVLFAFAAASPAVASAAKADAKVTITGYSPPPLLGSFIGAVKSDVKACEKNREVTVYRRAGEDNVEVGSASTARGGKRWVWQVFGGESTPAKYFALAPPTTKCKSAESKIYKYPNPARTSGRAGGNKATVEIVSFQTGGPQASLPGTFYGNVIADKAKCGKGRKISMFERTDSGNEKFPVRTSSEETKPGVYTWDINGMAQDGDTFFAKMKKKGKCKKAVSEDFNYPADNPGGARSHRASNTRRASA